MYLVPAAKANEKTGDELEPVSVSPDDKAKNLSLFH